MNNDALNNVRRKINEIMTKEDGKIVVGWRPGLEEKREEGDVWETLDGRKWTIKNGIRQSVTKLEGANTPWWCPKCQKSMNHRLDSKFWRLRGHCFDCNVKEETKMRAEGRWKEYEQNIMRANYIAALKDRIAELQDYHDNVSNPEVIHADNIENRIMMIEKWNVDLDTIRKDLREEIEKLQDNLQKAEVALEEPYEDTGNSN
jgi:hypothetical protein